MFGLHALTGKLCNMFFKFLYRDIYNHKIYLLYTPFSNIIRILCSKTSISYYCVGKNKYYYYYQDTMRYMTTKKVSIEVYCILYLLRHHQPRASCLGY